MELETKFMELESEFHGQIILTAEDGSEETFFVLEEATIDGKTYLLVANSLEGDSDALILQQTGDIQVKESTSTEVKKPTSDDILTYEVLDDENKISVISKYFEDLIDDINFEVE